MSKVEDHVVRGMSLLNNNTYASIFFQNTTENNADQASSKEHISEDLVSLICKFIDIYQKENTSNEEHVKALKYLNDVFRKQNDHVDLKWFPKYKCVLIEV